MKLLSVLSICVGLAGFASAVAGFAGSARQQDVVADVINSLPLISNDNMTFMGNISIGNPPQNLTVIFDLSATNFILYFGKFTPNPSIVSTYKPVVGINGMSAESSVSIAGLNITQQELVIATTSNADTNAAGVFGLGYTASDINGMASPLYNLISKNLISQQLFSLQLQLVDEANFKVDGTLFLGALNSSLQSMQPLYVDGTNVSDWQFNVSSSFINGTSLGPTSIQLTASSVAIAVPDTIYSNLSQYIQPIVNSSDFLSIPCDWIEPLFAFSIGNTNLTLYAADFMIGATNPAGHSTCVFKVASSGSDIWCLGTPLLSKYYTIFDVAGSRIGFVDTKTSTIPDEATTSTESSSSVTTPSASTVITSTTKDPGNAAIGSFTWRVYQHLMLFVCILILFK